jgi:glycosyltransferase involved in cell wall biosynthesis
MASLLNFVATKIHHFIKIFDLIPIFVVPSAFTISKLVEGGINPTKVVHIPTFVSIHGNVTLRKKQIVYVGRLEYIKGAHLLLEAINILRQGQNIVVQTVIVGFGDSKYLKSLQEYVNHNELTNVSFVGQKQPDEILSIFKESMVSVCPSLWYDNQPNVVLESLSCATPVIAPDHGSFPELITNGSNGFLFLPGNSSDLANKILLMFDLKTDHAKMQENALRYVMEHHSQETHYLKLINILNSLKGTVHV